jgi:hypothetical protein
MTYSDDQTLGGVATWRAQRLPGAVAASLAGRHAVSRETALTAGVPARVRRG